MSFDKFASAVASQVSRAWFFALCVLLVVVWLPTLFFMPIDSSQLIINTGTTIITFLLVALLENTQNRDFKAIHAKLDALIDLSEATNELERLEESSEKEIEKVRKKASQAKKKK